MQPLTTAFTIWQYVCMFIDCNGAYKVYTILIQKIWEEKTKNMETCLGAPEKTVVWIHIILNNNMVIKNIFTRYLKESCWLCYKQHFSFKYFPKYAVGWKISSKIVRPLLAALSINGLRDSDCEVTLKLFRWWVDQKTMGWIVYCHDTKVIFINNC